MKFSDWWKEISAVLACVGVLTYAGLRVSHAEEKIKTHDEKHKAADELHAVQTQILEELVEQRKMESAIEDAEKATRNKICRELRESGKISKGECPPLE